MRVACVIPAWNEANTLESVVRSLNGKVDDIIVVDDGSVDGTDVIMKNLPIHALFHVVNRGQGAALRTGTTHACLIGADIIVHFDADGQFRTEDIARVIKPLLDREADIVFGSRFLDNTTAMPKLKRQVIIPIARVVNKILFNISTTDPQSGFRAMTKEAFDRLDWQHDDMAHCSEILAEAHRNKLQIVEVPITVIYHDFGQKFSGGIKIISDILLGRLNKR